MVTSSVSEFNFEEGAGVLDELKETSRLDVSPGDAKVEHLSHVDVLLKTATHWVDSHVPSGVVTRDASLSAESDEIRSTSISLLQIPVLMSPHLS